MSAAITLEELVAWNDEAAAFWKSHLESNPALLDLPCGIGGAVNVQNWFATSGEPNCAGPSASPVSL